MSNNFKENNVELNEDYNINSQEDFSIEDYLHVINRRKWIVIIVTLSILITGVLFTNSKTRMYSSTSKIISSQDSSTGGLGDINEISALSNLRSLTNNPLEVVMEIIKSRQTVNKAFSMLTDEEKIKGFGNKNSVGGKAVDVYLEDDKSSIINVKVTAQDPNVAAKLANLIVEVYFANEANIYSQYTVEARNRIREEMTKVEAELEVVRRKLISLKQKTGIYSLENDIQLKVTDKNSTEKAISDVDVKIAEASARLAETKAQIRELSDKTKSTGTMVNPAVTGSLSRIDELTTERNGLLQKYTSDSPEVKAIDQKIAFETSKLKNSDQYYENSYTLIDNPTKAELKDQLVKIQIEIKSYEETKNELLSLYDISNNKLKALPKSEDEIIKATDLYMMLKDNLSLLTGNYYKLLFNGQSNIQTGRVLSAATSNPVPVEPNLSKAFIMFFVVGFLLSLILAIFIDNIDNIIYDISSMRKITSIPCLARIPLINISDGEKLQIGKLTGNSNFLESFRIFRNNIMLTELISESQGVDRQRTFAITGPDAKQGKTTVSVNLAIAMALDGNRVLLVDTDLRKPNIAKQFGVSNDIGYTNLVKNTSTLSESVKSTEVENLFVLPSGPLPPNPTEFLNSDANRNLVKRLEKEFDVVIYDTSPCTFISDTQIVSTFVDAVVLVITVKNTRIPLVKTAFEQLLQVKAPLIGYVLNKIPVSKRKGYYSNYYYYASDEKD